MERSTVHSNERASVFIGVCSTFKDGMIVRDATYYDLENRSFMDA
jgi:hypothetical protein